MSLKEKFKEKLVEALNEDVYKVEHEGHPDAETGNLYKHLPVNGKKYTNHITKYPDSAKKAADMLKKAGFKGVKVYKNWKLMEEVELDESNLTPSSVKVKIIKNGNKHELTIRQPNRKVTGYHKSFDSREDAEKFVHQKWGADALNEGLGDFFNNMAAKKIAKAIDQGGPGSAVAMAAHFATYPESKKKNIRGAVSTYLKTNKHAGLEKFHDFIKEEVELDEAKDPFAGTPWSAKKTKEKLLNDVKKRIGMDKPETKEPKSVVKDGKRVFESIELDEGKMSELASDIGDHMDKHISNYKRAGGAEALMAHAAKASHKIAKMHGIEHKHAEKFVSDYIEGRLNEETLEEFELDESVDPSVHLKKARSAANRDEQELYVKHMINYHKAMIKTNPDQAAVHTEKLNRLKKDIGESVVEGFNSMIKKFKRGLQGWDKSFDDGPKELVKRHAAYDDETIKKLAKGSDDEKPFTHSPRGLQNKVLKRELKKRNLE